MEILNYEEEQRKKEQSQQSPVKTTEVDEESIEIPDFSQQLKHQISAIITGYKSIQSTFNSYSVYEITLTTDCPEYGNLKNFMIERRFSHFLDLYSRLISLYTETTIPVPPPKNYSEFAALEMIEANRIIWLQIFLDMILLNPILRTSALVINFLTNKTAPDSIQKSPVGILKENMGKFTEILISLKYADMDSDEWYLDLKNQLFKIESGTKALIQSLGGSSLGFKSISQDFLKSQHIIREFSTLIGAGAPEKSINALSDIFKTIAEHCNREGPLKDKFNCYNSVYSILIAHLGSLNLIVRTFKIAFDERERNFRPISDLDADLKELQISLTLGNLPDPKKSSIEEVIAKKSNEIQQRKKNFSDFSKNQKGILSLYKKYLEKYVKTTIQSFLESILQVEKSKHENLKQIRISLN